MQMCENQLGEMYVAGEASMCMCEHRGWRESNMDDLPQVKPPVPRSNGTDGHG